MGFSLEYKCIVTYSLPGDYFYDKWWDDGLIPQALSEAKGWNWKPNQWYLKDLTTSCPLSLYFVADDLTIILRLGLSLSKGQKYIGYTCLVSGLIWLSLENS